MPGRNHNKFIKHETYSSQMPIIGSFDIETLGIGLAFIIGMTDTFLGEHLVHFTLDSLFEEILAHPGMTWFAHNGARFDFVYLASRLKTWCEEHGHIIETIDSGSTTIGIILGEVGDNGEVKRNQKQIVIRDSMRLTGPMSLYDFTKSFAPDHMKLKGEIDFAGGEVFDPDNERHMMYLERDVDGLFAALMKLHETCFENFGVYPSWTGPSTAVRAWKTTIPEGHVFYRQTPRKEAFARKAYYGGFVFIGHDVLVHQDCMGIDVKAAYANAMRKGVPVGIGTFTKNYVRGKPGVYEVIATNAKQKQWPLVQYKDKEGLHWLNQNVHTFITSIELVWLKKRGWTFKILKGLVYDRLEPIFNTFLDMCASLELPVDGSKPDPAKKGVAKIFRNGLYGKLGMKSEIERVVYAESVPVNSGYIPMITVAGDEVEGAWTKSEYVDADYINPHWAAFITAHQRLYLFEAMEAVGVEYVFYCDTDSIKGDREAIQTAIDANKIKLGKHYGDFEIDGKYDWLQVEAPKVYHGEYTDAWIESEGLASKWFGRAKGIPMYILKSHPEILQQANEGIREQQHFDSMVSFRQALRDGEDQIYRERKRKVTDLGNSAAWMTLDDGKVVPRPVKVKWPKGYGDMEFEDTAQDIIEMLVNAGLSKVEIAGNLGISKQALYKFDSGLGTGKKYLLPLKDMLHQTINISSNTSVINAA